MSDKLKSSYEWCEEIKDFCDILDPDGWDRSPKNFENSLNEKISKKEFLKRLYSSTIKCDVNKLTQWIKE